MNNNSHIIDVLIENIKKDQHLLKEKEQELFKAKEERQAIVQRLKDHEKDVGVMLKYSDDTKRKEIEALGLTLMKEHGLNPIAETAFNLVIQAKDNQLSNGKWYDMYLSGLRDNEDEVSYTEFNIKCRSLFNTGRLIRKKGNNATSSRDDIISLNGSVTARTTFKPKK